MLKDQSLLRRLTWERLRSLDECGVSVVELGGKKDGGHARLFRDKGCHYLALGFEGDLPFDLRTGKSPLEDASADVVLISMVAMYLNGETETPEALSEAYRILKPGGRLYLFEPFLYGDTPHGPIADRSRWSAEEMRDLLLRRGFDGTKTRRRVRHALRSAPRSAPGILVSAARILHGCGCRVGPEPGFRSVFPPSERILLPGTFLHGS